MNNLSSFDTRQLNVIFGEFIQIPKCAFNSPKFATFSGNCKKTKAKTMFIKFNLDTARNCPTPPGKRRRKDIWYAFSYRSSHLTFGKRKKKASLWQTQNKRRKINPPSNSPPSPLPTCLSPSSPTPSHTFTAGFEAEDLERSEVEVEVEMDSSKKKDEDIVEELGRGKRIRRRPSYLQDYVVTYHA